MCDAVSGIFLNDSLSVEVMKNFWEFPTFNFRGWGVSPLLPSHYDSRLRSPCLLSACMSPCLLSIRLFPVSLSPISHLPVSFSPYLWSPVSQSLCFPVPCLPSSCLSLPVSLSHAFIDVYEVSILTLAQ